MQFVLDEYKHDLESRIDLSWLSGKCLDGLGQRITVIFQIARNGNISNIRLLVSCGDKALDSAAVKAIEKVSPFELLPKIAPNRMDVEYTFRLPNRSAHAVFRQISS